MRNIGSVIVKKLTGPVACLAASILFLVSGSVFAASGISTIASNVMTNLSSVAQLITAGAYVAGFAFGVAAIVKFKAHKDNPTQVMISQPIVLLFVAAALIFIPSVFRSSGATLFGSGSTSNNATSGVSSF